MYPDHTAAKSIAHSLQSRLTALSEADDKQAARLDLWEFAVRLQDLAANAGAPYVDRLRVDEAGPWLEGTGAYIGQATESLRRDFVATKTKAPA